MKKVGTFVFIVLIVAAGVFFERHQVVKAVAGTGVLRGMYSQATIQIPHTSGATSYNIYYKQPADSTFINSVRNVPTNISSYTISYLKKNVSYEYKISALDKNGKEFWWSEVKPITDLQSM